MTPKESISLSRETTGADVAGGEKVCPVCSREKREEFVPLIALVARGFLNELRNVS
jgi:hypothetical protein